MTDLVVRGLEPAEYEAAIRLASQVFGRGDADMEGRILRRWRNRLSGNAPDFAYALHRVGLIDGEIVSHIRIVPGILRYGRAALRVMGISAVCTHPDHRDQGYAAAVMQDAMLLIAEYQAHLSLLTGINNYYDRFGFNPVWPHYYVEIPAADAALLDSPLHMRPGEAADISQLAALFEKHWGGRVTFTRSPAMWAWQIWDGTRAYFQVVEDDYGQISGYIAAYSDTDLMAEVLADTPDAARLLLATAGQNFLAAGKATIRWLLPPDDALVIAARDWLMVTVKAEYRPNGGWMGRVMDARALVNALLPEIVTQAQAVQPAFDPTRLLIEAAGDGVTVGLRGQKITYSHIAHRDFIQIVFGSLRPAALTLRQGADLSPEAVRLLELLFPPRLACLSAWDWF
ncbi:MAG: GNAT family N-acetyltransferase [Anaerolineae bacterium]|nr:GNAT family N-acetyltransferase [Anaerolineae bacterium]